MRDHRPSPLDHSSAARLFPLLPFALSPFSHSSVTTDYIHFLVSVLLGDNVPAPEPAAVRAEGGDDLRVPRLDRGDKGREVSEQITEGEINAWKLTEITSVTHYLIIIKRSGAPRKKR